MDTDNDSNILTEFLQKKIVQLCKLLWTGIVKTSSKNKFIALIYFNLVMFTLSRGLLTGKWVFSIVIIFLVAIVLGLRYKKSELPMNEKQKRNFCRQIFAAMNFRASDNHLPYLLHETELSEYASVFSFNTLIPVNKWLSRKGDLEMYMGNKIMDIKQDPEESRIVHVIVQVNPLPEYIEWNDEFLIDNNVLSIGMHSAGMVGMNLEQHPHAFIAGETGSGKSNILKCLIYQALSKQYEVVLIDFKRGVSFMSFSDKVAIYYDYPEVIKVLKDAVSETNRRLDKFRTARVDNINDYNRTSNDFLPRKIIFIDELAELLKTRDKETSNTLYDSIETLTRLSRAVGIHLIMGIQRPDSTIVNGQIKNNVSYRVCGRFVDREPSRIMLSCDAASSLVNIKGRFIVKDDSLYEVQSFYFQGGSASQRTESPAQAATMNTTQTYQTQPDKEKKTQTAQAAKTLKSTKTTMADLFFATRDKFHQGGNPTEMAAVMTISEQINPLLLACQREEIRFKNPNELGLALVELLLKEAGIDPSQYVVSTFQKTLQQLLEDDANEAAYSRQAQYAANTKLTSGDIEETPLFLLLSLVTDFVCRSTGLLGEGAYRDKLYKLFTYEEQLPEPLFPIWAALAVATEFDTDLWDDYQIKLFDFKSGKQAAQTMDQYPSYQEQSQSIEIVPPPTETVGKSPVTAESPKEEPLQTEMHHQPSSPPLPEQPEDSDSFEFDFSGFRK